MNKKLIVTVFGGSGFLGGHVADELSKAGYHVRVFDRRISPWLRKDQEMIVGDVLNMDSVIQAVKDSDIIYNFAALADLDDTLERPLETIEVNILGNTYILEACRVHRVKRFVYASTVYVYSRDGGFYRCSKQASELCVEEYQRAFGVNYTILRYGSLYGPRADEHNGLFRIVRNTLKTGKIQYKGHPEAMREYIHVEDAARASITILAEDFCNQSIVLTGHEAMRVEDMLKMLAEIMGISDRVEYIDSPYRGHYIRTPYAYQPKAGRKYVPPFHVDLGQGLLQLIEDVEQKISMQNKYAPTD